MNKQENNEPEFFGPHLMLDLSECDFKTLIDDKKLKKLLADLPGIIGMTKISEPNVLTYLDKWAETPGVTGIVILAESHISLHTFPDSKYAFLDIFSCRNFDTEKTKKYLIKFFGSKKPTVHFAKRGIDFNKALAPKYLEASRKIKTVQKA